MANAVVSSLDLLLFLVQGYFLLDDTNFRDTSLLL